MSPGFAQTSRMKRNDAKLQTGLFINIINIKI